MIKCLFRNYKQDKEKNIFYFMFSFFEEKNDCLSFTSCILLKISLWKKFSNSTNSDVKLFIFIFFGSQHQ